LNSRRSVLALVATVAAIAGLALLLPRWRAVPIDAAGTVRLADCDLNNGPCVVTLDGDRRVEFSIAPRPVPVMQPLRLRLATQGFAAPLNAQVDFVGVDMDMGFNRVDLKPAADGTLGGEASLPVCVTGTMDWQAELLLRRPDHAVPTRIRFRFAAPLSAGR